MYETVLGKLYHSTEITRQWYISEKWSVLMRQLPLKLQVKCHRKSASGWYVFDDQTDTNK